MSGDGIFNWRPMRTSDVTAWAALLADIREVDHTWEYFTETELLEEFDDPRRNFEDGSIVVFAGDTMVGYGVLVTRSTAEPDHDMRFDGGVHPAYRGRGLGSQLLDWAEPAARRLHRALYPGHPLSLAGSCSIDSPAAMALYESRGYEQVRWFNGMVRDLGDAVGGPVAPPGVEIAPWRPEFSEDARMMRNEAFRDHWGSSDVAPEDWAHFMAVAAFRPDYSFVAFANGEPAGFIIAQEYAEPGTAGRDLYIATVGTRAAHRKRGVASALLTRALSGAKAAGFAQASLDVDADSPTGALGLYTSLGFVRVHTYVMLKKSPL